MPVTTKENKQLTEDEKENVMMKKITYEELQAMLNDDQEKLLVVVCYGPPCCSPAIKMVELCGLVADSRDDVDFVKIDGLEESDYAVAYDFNVVPVTIFFRGGKEIGRLDNLVTMKHLNNTIDDCMQAEVST